MEKLRPEQLREKANMLPLLPGVYIMLNAQNEVIYVGQYSTGIITRSEYCSAIVFIKPLQLSEPLVRTSITPPAIQIIRIIRMP